MHIDKHYKYGATVYAENWISLVYLLSLYFIIFTYSGFTYGLAWFFNYITDTMPLLIINVGLLSALLNTETYAVVAVPQISELIWAARRPPSKRLRRIPIEKLQSIEAKRANWLVGARLHFQFDDDEVQIVRDTWPRWAFWKKLDINAVGKSFADIAGVNFKRDVG